MVALRAIRVLFCSCQEKLCLSCFNFNCFLFFVYNITIPFSLPNTPIYPSLSNLWPPFCQLFISMYTHIHTYSLKLRYNLHSLYRVTCMYIFILRKHLILLIECTIENYLKSNSLISNVFLFSCKNSNNLYY